VNHEGHEERNQLTPGLRRHSIADGEVEATAGDGAMDWSQIRVLVVEPSDSAGAASGRVFLSARGAHVEVVRDLADALVLLNHTPESHAALVFSVGDFEQDELGPLRAIRALHPETALVACVDAGSRRRGGTALQLGADALLPEPFYGGELLLLIERLTSRIAGRPVAAAEVVEVGTVLEAVSAVEAAPGPDAPAANVEIVAPPLGPAAQPASVPAPPSVTPAEHEAVVGPGSPALQAEPARAPVPEAPREPARAEPTPAADTRPAGPGWGEAAAAGSLRAETDLGGRVLLVNNERLFRELVADVLRQRGYYVTDAADEKQALWCLADADYDAIVVDAQVNGSGQGLRSFRQAAPETPVVAVTSLFSREEEAALREAGAAACLGKPFDIDQLIQVLRGVMKPARPIHPVLTPEEMDALLAPHPEPGANDHLDPDTGSSHSGR